MPVEGQEKRLLKKAAKLTTSYDETEVLRRAVEIAVAEELEAKKPARKHLKKFVQDTGFLAKYLRKRLAKGTKADSEMEPQLASLPASTLGANPSNVQTTVLQGHGAYPEATAAEAPPADSTAKKRKKSAAFPSGGDNQQDLSENAQAAGEAPVQKQKKRAKKAAAAAQAAAEPVEMPSANISQASQPKVTGLPSIPPPPSTALDTNLDAAAWQAAFAPAGSALGASDVDKATSDAINASLMSAMAASGTDPASMPLGMALQDSTFESLLNTFQADDSGAGAPATHGGMPASSGLDVGMIPAVPPPAFGTLPPPAGAAFPLAVDGTLTGNQSSLAPSTSNMAEYSRKTKRSPDDAATDAWRTWREDEERTNVKAGPYSTAEDQKLLEAANNYAQAHGLPIGDYAWLREIKKHNHNGLMKTIAAALPDRKFTSVWSRLFRLTHPGNHKGPWSQEEDEKLRNLFKEHGSKWTIIGNEIGRLPQLCRDRWRRIGGGDSVEKGRWSQEDEERLNSIVTAFLENKKTAEAMVAASADQSELVIGGAPPPLSAHLPDTPPAVSGVPPAAVPLPMHLNASSDVPPASGLAALSSPLAAGNAAAKKGSGKVGRKLNSKVDARMVRDDIDWDAIAAQMRTRNASQCMEKWYMKLRPSETETGEWSRVDDKQLLTSLWNAKPKFECQVDWDHAVPNRCAIKSRRRWHLMRSTVPSWRNMEFHQQVLFLATKHLPELLVDGTAVGRYAVDPAAAQAALAANAAHKTAQHMEIAKCIAIGAPLPVQEPPAAPVAEQDAASMQMVAPAALLHGTDPQS